MINGNTDATQAMSYTQLASIRSSILLFLVLMVASCSLLPPRRPLGPTALPPSPTPPPAPLLSISGSRPSYASTQFFASAAGWIARWSYDCTNALRSRPHLAWRVALIAREERVHVASTAEPIVEVRSPTSAGSSGPPVRDHGVKIMTIRGILYVEVHAFKGCSWRVAALPGTR
jgi:hypothetical protein